MIISFIRRRLLARRMLFATPTYRSYMEHRRRDPGSVGTAIYRRILRAHADAIAAQLDLHNADDYMSWPPQPQVERAWLTVLVVLVLLFVAISIAKVMP